VVRSSQVAQIEQEQVQPPPKTPPKPSPGLESGLLILTPQNRRQLVDAIHSISSKEAISRPVRTLLWKATKGFDKLHSANAQGSLQLAAQARKITELANKKKKKVAINCNEVFANIATIKAAQEEQERVQAEWNRRDRVEEARRTANVMIANQVAVFQHEFHINTLV
jgi:hypothetical protein